MDLSKLRGRIDELDDQLIKILAERMDVVVEVAKTKKANNEEVIQKNRWQELLETRSEWGEKAGLPQEDVRAIFECIHQMSVNRQNTIVQE